MSTALVIASRELRDRTRVLIVGAALAILPFLVALMPSAESNRATVISALGGGAAMAYGLCLALMYGVSALGRELSEKRLSFYFSKPIAPVALWLGKTGAALVTVAGVALLVAIPSFLAAREEWLVFWGREDWFVWKLIAVVALFLYFGGHALSTMVRSRSALVALDLVCAVATVMLALMLVRPLLERGAVERVFAVWAVLAGAALLAAAIVPVVQLSRGRTDVRRSHAAYSSVLWPVIGVSLLIAAAYTMWVTSPSLKSIDKIENLDQSASGQWVFFTGTDSARGDVASSFLLNTATGASERIQPLRWSSVKFSRDGRTLVWVESDELLPRFGAARVHTRTLDGSGADGETSIATGISDAFTVSDDGTRIAILGRGQLRVHELASGKLLAATRMNQSDVRSLFFVSPATVRIVSAPRLEKTASILELDVTRKALVKTGQFAVGESFGFNALTATPDGAALYVNRAGTIRDGRTGAMRVQLPIAPKTHRASVMLRDGRVVWVHDGVLELYDPSGARVREVKLPVSGGLIMGETENGHVLVTGRLGAPAPGVRGRKFVRVDLQRGAVVSVKEDVWGAVRWWGIDPRLPVYTADARFSGMNVEDRLTHWQQ